jgi:hypothetical protein
MISSFSDAEYLMLLAPIPERAFFEQTILHSKTNLTRAHYALRPKISTFQRQAPLSITETISIVSPPITQIRGD